MFFEYVDKMLLLITDDDKSVQKSAMSNFQLLLQNPRVADKLAPKISHISKVS